MQIDNLSIIKVIKISGFHMKTAIVGLQIIGNKSTTITVICGIWSHRAFSINWLNELDK